VIAAMPEIVAQVRAAHLRQSALTVTERQRNILRSQSSHDDNRRDRDEFDEVEVPMHTVRGGVWLAADTRKPEIELKSGVTLLGSALHFADEAKRDPQQHHRVTKKVREFLKSAKDGIANVRRASEIMRGAEAFMTKPHIDGLVRWANHQGSPLLNVAYEATPRGLAKADDRTDIVTVELPVGYAPPTFSTLDDLVEVISRCEKLAAPRRS
jgi:hypothetical protein